MCHKCDERRAKETPEQTAERVKFQSLTDACRPILTEIADAPEPEDGMGFRELVDQVAAELVKRHGATLEDAYKAAAIHFALEADIAIGRSQVGPLAELADILDVSGSLGGGSRVMRKGGITLIELKIGPRPAGPPEEARDEPAKGPEAGEATHAPTEPPPAATAPQSAARRFPFQSP